MTRKLTIPVVLVLVSLISGIIQPAQPVQAATYNFCGQVLFANIGDVNHTLLLHCNTTYAVFFDQGLPVTSRTWVQLTGASINFFNPYIIYTYNAIPWKIVGSVVSFGEAITNLSACLSCTTFVPPAIPTPTKTATRTATKLAPTSTFPWYTLTPSLKTATPTLRIVTPTALTSTASRTFTQTVTRTPTRTATSAVDFSLARMRVDQKRGIITRLGTLSIQTSLINIPIITRIDEGSSVALVNEIESQISAKTLTQAKLDAFHRLILQEQAVESLLPLYADASAQIAKPMADTIKAFMGFSSVLKRAISLCKGQICVRAQTRLFDLMTKMLRDMVTDSIKQFPGDAFPKDTTAKIMDIAMRLVAVPLDRGQALGSLLVDNSVEFSISGLLVSSFVDQMQTGIDRGVNTVRSAPNPGFYKITGSADRAAGMLNDLVQKASWADQSAQERYKSFNRASDLAGFAQDAASVFSMALFPPAVLINLVSRAERIALNAVSTWGSLDDLNCINYLGKRAVEMAFDSQVPGEDCKYRKSSALPASGYHLAIVQQRTSPRSAPATFLQDVEAYKSSLSELVKVASGGRSLDFEQALERFGAAEEALSRTMKRFNAQAVTAPDVTDFEVEMLAADKRFSLANVAIYISAVDLSTALSEGKQSQTKLVEPAQTALFALEDYIDAMERVNLIVPDGLPLITLENLAVNRAGSEINLEARVTNFGKGTARGVRLAVGDGERVLSTLVLADLDANQEAKLSKKITIPAGTGSLTVTLWLGEEAVDSRVVWLPEVGGQPAQATQTPIQVKVQTSTPIPARPQATATPTSFLTGLCPGASLILAFPLTVGLFGLLLNKKRRNLK